jgi:hypothetical protein
MKPTRAIIVGAISGLASSAAFAASGASLPAEQQQGGIAYLTGGVGADQAKAFEQAAPRFPLALEFVEHAPRRDEFVANVDVKIIDRHGQTVLATRADGPFLLARIPTGHYHVIATYEGKTLKRAVEVGGKAARPTVMEWKGTAKQG